MSLRLYIEQIQRPTWWHDGENDYPYQRHGKVSCIVKQEAVLAALRSTRRADAKALVLATGFTTQSIRYVTAQLIKQGQIRRIDASGNRVFWEAVKIPT